MQTRRSCDVHSFLNIPSGNVIFALLKKTNVKPVNGKPVNSRGSCLKGPV